MQHKTPVIVLSLGQLNNSSVTTGVFEFGALLNNQYGGYSIIYPMCVGYSGLAYLYDMFVDGTIESFKKGVITDAQFRSYIKSWYGANITDQQVDAAWNSLCKLNTFSSSNIESLGKFLAFNKNMKALILSTTNEINFSSQDFSVLEKLGDQVIYGLSFQHNTTSLPDIAKNELNKLGVVEVVSLHRDITSNSLGDVYDFKYSLQYNPSKEGLVGDYLNKVLHQTAHDGAVSHFSV